MHVLIIGGTQFVGRHVGEELLEQGHSITLLNRGVTPDPFPDGVERLRADRTKPEQVRAALEGRSFDAVVDCIGYHRDEIELSIELFGGRIGRYVFMSSMAVYKPSELLPIEESMPLNEGTSWEYAQEKIGIEQRLASIDPDRFPAVRLRLGYVYGPYNNNPLCEFAYFQRIEQGRPVPVPGDGHFFFHQTHARDLAHATIAALQRDEAVGNVYNIVGRYAQSANEFVRAAGEAVGRPVEIVHTPQITSRREAERFFFFQPRLTNVYSSEAARRDLAWEPRFDIVDGLKDAYRWYRETNYAKSHPFDFSADDEALATVRAGS